MTTVQESHYFLCDHGIDLRHLHTMYQGDDRVYHGMDHIAQMLTAVEEMVKRYDIEERQRIRLHLATWYHDAVYVVGSKSNEEDSAALFLHDYYDGLFWLPWGRDADIVHDTILATKSHQNVVTFDDAIVIDADLQGLGSDRRVYQRNREKVRSEIFPGYSGTAQELTAWVTGRKAFLTAYLNRPTLYFTSWGAEYEWPARYNMQQELQSLSEEI